jgi:hypothetical protein
VIDERGVEGGRGGSEGVRRPNLGSGNQLGSSSGRMV